jgi:phosphoribosyl-ATP pyrophosphohydrolase/phosphoribosyl-AMP cyclohydrolase/histidinol dehydrogenase
MSDVLLRRVAFADAMVKRSHAIDGATLDATRLLLAEIDAPDGEAIDSKIVRLAARFGDVGVGARVVLGPGELEAALSRLTADARGALERAAERIRAFARAQRSCLADLRMPVPGGWAGHTWKPVEAAGCYAPGGRYPLPSSVLMTAITAREAGVSSVWVASPRPTDATLAAAALAGADGVLAIGGVQAIAAMARGACGVPRCDIIVGPGNRWVTAAKFLLSGEVGIDMLAGPSELLVLADETASPELIAADLLAQAEHDEDAIASVISTSPPLLDAVEAELARQLADLPTASVARAALRNGISVHAPSVEAMCSLCDRIAPEHLEVMTRDAGAVAGSVRSAGAIFVGAGSAEVLGDYGAGPNHVLPTGGTARFRAGLSVATFLRARTWLEIDDSDKAEGIARDATTIARLEGLEGHARSAWARVGSRTV